MNSKGNGVAMLVPICEWHQRVKTITLNKFKTSHEMRAILKLTRLALASVLGPFGVHLLTFTQFIDALFMVIGISG